jgi:hypothetical protein
MMIAIQLHALSSVSRVSAATSVAPAFASDEFTRNDALAILSRVTFRPFSYYQVPLDVIRQRIGEDAVKIYEWFDRVGFTVDRAALQREFPDVDFHDFESWAKTQDWDALLS